ncbi:MAG: thioredoxin [Chloroflexi bacterium]|nr:thioredoxin [Chloroflexota bacterium]
MAHPIAITDTSFEDEVIKSETPVLVDFWAEWCGPCKMIAPIVDELAREYDGKIKFTKMDVDVNVRTPMKFGIRGIPTLILFNDGKAVEQIVGAVPKSVLKKKLDSALA